MKAVVIVLVLLVQSLFVAAQSRDEVEVQKAIDVLRKGMIDGDRAALERITSKNLTYGHSAGKLEDQAAFVEALASGKSDFVTITLSEQTILIEKNTAIVRHKLVAETNDGGKPGNANIGVLLVWTKEKGGWKLLARQAFKLQSN